MPLFKKTVSIPFTGGLNEEADSHGLVPPNVARAVNTRFDKTGAARKRLGFSALNGNDLPTDTTGVNIPFARGGETCLYSAKGLYSWSETQGGWLQRSISHVPPLEFDRVQHISPIDDITSYDVAYDAADDMVAEVWEDNGRCWYQVREYSTGTLLVAPTPIGSGFLTSPRVLFYAGLFFFFGLEGTPSLYSRSLDPSTLSLGAQNLLIAGNMISYSVHVDSAAATSAAMCTVDATANPYYIKKINSVGLLSASTAAGAVTSAPLAIRLDSNNQRVYIGGLGGAGTGFLECWDFSTLVGPPLGAIGGLIDTTWNGVSSTYTSFNNLDFELLEGGDIWFVSCAYHNFELLPRPTVAGSQGAWNRTFYASQWVLVTNSWFGASLTGLSSNVFYAPHLLLTSRISRLPSPQPSCTAQFTLSYEALDTSLALAKRGVAANQRAHFLLSVDPTSNGVNPGTGGPDGTPAAYPIPLCRYFDGSATVLDARDKIVSVVPPVLSPLSGILAVGSKILIGSMLTYKSKTGVLDGTVYRTRRSGAILELQGKFTSAKDQREISLVSFEFNPGAIQAFSGRRSSLINTGGLLLTYDGSIIGEASPLSQPELTYVKLDGLGTGQQPANTLHFPRVIETVVTNAGEERRSGLSYVPIGARRFNQTFGPSLGLFLGTPTGSIHNVQAYFTTPAVTLFREDAHIGYLYQEYESATESTGGGWHEDSENYGFHFADAPTASTLRVGEAYVVNPTAFDSGNASLNGNQADNAPDDYESSGELTNMAPPPFLHMAKTTTRYVAISAENRSELWFSKILSFGRLPEWNPELTMQAGQESPLTAVAQMDDKIIAFSNDQIFLVTGSLPNNLGENNAASLEPVSSDTGCVTKRSVVEGPFGVMFQGKNGIYVLDRGLSLTRLPNVEDSLASATLLQALAVPQDSTVRFILDNNTTLVYDYDNHVWSSYTSTNVVAANNVAGRLVATSNTALGYAARRENLETDAFPHTDDGPTRNNMRLTTGWIQLDPKLGIQRLRRICLLGKYVNNDRGGGGNDDSYITVRLSYDYDETVVDSHVIDHTFPADREFAYKIVPKRQKVASVKIDIEETSAGVETIEGFTFTGIDLELGLTQASELFKNTLERS